MIKNGRLCVWSMLILLLLSLSACKTVESTDEDNLIEQLPARLIRFDKDFFSIYPDNLTQQSVERLKERYGDFFTYYAVGILGISNPEQPQFLQELKQFFDYSVTQEAYEQVAEKFANVSRLNDELMKAFDRYSTHYKDSLVPKVYAYISGFNQPLMLTDSAVGVSLEMFLGRDALLYSELGIAPYKQKNMYQERIPSEVVKAWAIGMYPWDAMGESLLASMVHEGRLMYFVKTLMPNIADTTLFGFTKEELRWCNDFEREVWVDLVENKLLFETQYARVKRMVEDAPFTPMISRDSPGRTVCWVGYRIVERYMKRSSATLQELMAEENVRMVLEQAEYNP